MIQPEATVMPVVDSTGASLGLWIVQLPGDFSLFPTESEAQDFAAQLSEARRRVARLEADGVS